MIWWKRHCSSWIQGSGIEFLHLWYPPEGFPQRLAPVSLQPLLCTAALTIITWNMAHWDFISPATPQKFGQSSPGGGCWRPPWQDLQSDVPSILALFVWHMVYMPYGGNASREEWFQNPNYRGKSHYMYLVSLSLWMQPNPHWLGQTHDPLSDWALPGSMSTGLSTMPPSPGPFRRPGSRAEPQ